MFRDELRNQVWENVRQCDCRAFQRFLQPQVFAEAEAEVGLAASALCKPALVWLVLQRPFLKTASFFEGAVDHPVCKISWISSIVPSKGRCSTRDCRGPAGVA